MEGLSWGATYRHFDNARATVQFPANNGNSWGYSDTGYLVSWFDGGCDWQREYLCAKNSGIGIIVFWAWDHIGLMSWSLPLPVNKVAAYLQ